MLAKFGLILLVLLFGVLMFAAGALAPSDWRQSVSKLAEEAQATISGKAKAAATVPASAEKPKAAEEAPISYESLLLSAAPAPNTRYALELGLYTEAAATERLQQKLAAQKIPFKLIPVIDRSGARWVVLAAGAYASPEDARNARPTMAKDLEVTQPVTVIQLPTEKKS